MCVRVRRRDGMDNFCTKERLIRELWLYCVRSHSSFTISLKIAHSDRLLFRFVYASRSSLASKFIAALWAFCVYYYCGSRIYSFISIHFIYFIRFLSLSVVLVRSFFVGIFSLFRLQFICGTCVLSFRMRSTLIWRKIESNSQLDISQCRHSSGLQHYVVSCRFFELNFSSIQIILNGLSSSFHSLNFSGCLRVIFIILCENALVKDEFIHSFW